MSSAAAGKPFKAMDFWHSAVQICCNDFQARQNNGFEIKTSRQQSRICNTWKDTNISHLNVQADRSQLGFLCRQNVWDLQTIHIMPSWQASSLGGNSQHCTLTENYGKWVRILHPMNFTSVVPRKPVQRYEERALRMWGDEEIEEHWDPVRLGLSWLGSHFFFSTGHVLTALAKVHRSHRCLRFAAPSCHVFPHRGSLDVESLGAVGWQLRGWRMAGSLYFWRHLGSAPCIQTAGHAVQCLGCF